MSDLLGDDPAAEFLQQEEDQLRELGIDDDQFAGGSSENGDEEEDMMDEFGGGVHVNQVDAMVNDFHNSSLQTNMKPAVEPESLKRWREEKSQALQKQEVQEAEARKEWEDKARKELEDWYNRYNEQLEKVHNENLVAQEQFVEEMTDTKPGNEWEKTARFCDFNPKFTKNTKDVSRMRSLLLQLKQNPLVR